MRFPCRFQTIIKCANDRIEAFGSHDRHIKDGTDTAPTAPDATPASKLAAITIHRRNAHEGGDLAAIQVPKFGEIGQKFPGQHLAHPRHTPQ